MLARFYDRLVGNRVKLDATEYPAFVYEEGSWDPRDPENGLLRGDLLIRVLRHIWTAPASAWFGLENEAIPAVCNARVHGVYQVTAEMIGYAGVQVRDSLHGVQHWKLRDGTYDYEQFYNSIVILFSDPDDEWAIETLKWYQR
ncbi:hypothetical protein B0H11DRAFT_1707147 [Mycena galericulata]|nr:hypothetical protein B0H11DRAFT_1707147 [Mycena galericulata]